jgi:hypothetical protein
MIASLTALSNGNSRSLGAKHARGCRFEDTKALQRADLGRTSTDLSCRRLPHELLAVHAGAGARSRAISIRISANICRDTATSAIWNVT